MKFKIDFKYAIKQNPPSLYMNLFPAISVV